MSIVLSTPNVSDLTTVAEVLSDWQYDNAPLQLHPGDLGWFSMRGPAKTAESIRIWTRENTILAIGLLDGPDGLLRMAIDPENRLNEELNQQIATDADDPRHGVLASGEAIVEARGATRLYELLQAKGWGKDEPWTPLYQDLSDSSTVSLQPFTAAGLRIETIGPDQVDSWTAVHWSAFKGTPFGEEQRHTFGNHWLTMNSGPFAERSRNLAAFDQDGNAVAVTTVWSAGTGRPGLIEPMGVHQDQRGHGYGVAISIAAASALRDMGSSSAIVCTESSNSRAVASYVSAGFTAHAEVEDMRRSGRVRFPM